MLYARSCTKCRLQGDLNFWPLAYKADTQQVIYGAILNIWCIAFPQTIIGKHRRIIERMNRRIAKEEQALKDSSHSIQEHDTAIYNTYSEINSTLSSGKEALEVRRKSWLVLVCYIHCIHVMPSVVTMGMSDPFLFCVVHYSVSWIQELAWVNT